MYRFACFLFCITLICSCSNKDDEYTFAGITLFEEPTLPLCPTADVEAVKQDCLYGFSSTVYTIISTSGRELAPNIPVTSASIAIKPDQGNSVYLINLDLSSSLPEEVFSYLKKKYGPPNDVYSNTTSSIKAHWQLDNYNISFDSKYLDLKTGEHYSMLMIYNMLGKPSNNK